jgi:hypothetical protein
MGHRTDPRATSSISARARTERSTTWTSATRTPPGRSGSARSAASGSSPATSRRSWSPPPSRPRDRPVPSILAPATGAVFRAGDTIAFAGAATDVEDGTLPASAFSWSIDFLHEGHVHPALPQTGVTSGTFVIPTSGHDFSGNTRYRFTLTVTDSDGLQGSTSVLIYPDKVNLTLDTVPSGLNLTLDGIPRPTPFVYDTLIGFQHTVDAPNQTVGQNIYTFGSWSDGAAQQHVITVPASAQSYTATFTVAQNLLPSGLVAGYRFNEGAGTTTADLSGNAITGTLVNGPTWTTGQYGGGLNFAGTSYVDLGSPALLQLTGSMTLTAWIRISTNPGDDGAIVAKLGAAGWQLKTTPDTGQRTLGIQISSSTGSTIQRYGSTVLSAATWYHVAGVYDAAARTLSVYLNGVLDNGALSGTVPASQYGWLPARASRALARRRATPSLQGAASARVGARGGSPAGHGAPPGARSTTDPGGRAGTGAPRTSLARASSSAEHHDPATRP